ATTRHAAEWWRSRSKEGAPVDARIVNTSSGAGLMGSVGQGAYSAAKAGIAALTLVESAEMGRYGVTANAIAPAARTRMTEEVFADRMQVPDAGFDVNNPANISPLVVWLGSAESAGVTGRVFEVEGGMISVADGWQHGPALDKGERWEPAEVGEAVVAGRPARMRRLLPAPELVGDRRALLGDLAVRCYRQPDHARATRVRSRLHPGADERPPHRGSRRVPRHRLRGHGARDRLR